MSLVFLSLPLSPLFPLLLSFSFFLLTFFSSSSLTTVRCLFRPRSVALLMSANNRRRPASGHAPSGHGRLPSYHGNRHRPYRQSISSTVHLRCRFIICRVSDIQWRAPWHGGAEAARPRPPCETSSRQGTLSQPLTV